MSSDGDQDAGATERNDEEATDAPATSPPTSPPTSAGDVQGQRQPCVTYVKYFVDEPVRSGFFFVLFSSFFLIFFSFSSPLFVRAAILLPFIIDSHRSFFLTFASF